MTFNEEIFDAYNASLQSFITIAVMCFEEEDFSEIILHVSGNLIAHIEDKKNFSPVDCDYIKHGAISLVESVVERAENISFEDLNTYS